MTAVERPAQRNTRQRTAVREALGRVGGFRTAQELYVELRRVGDKIGLSTVYRSLQGLAAADEVDVLHNDVGEAIYRLCSADDHHHHLMCRDCGRTVEIQSTEVERWAKDTARRHGFTSVTHTAELYGTCRTCS
jgi:Fur family ferric uptake transcriptional regulator